MVKHGHTRTGRVIPFVIQMVILISRHTRDKVLMFLIYRETMQEHQPETLGKRMR